MDNEIFEIIKNLIEGLSIGFFASIPLGPIGVLCIQRTLNKGRRSGFASGLGAASSDLIYAIIASFSISFVMSFVEQQKTIITILGAVFLIGLGLKIFFSDPTKNLNAPQQRRSINLWQDYFSTFGLTITNPLAIFLFLGAFSFVGGERDFYAHVALLAGVFCGASSWWFILTMLVGLFRKNLTIKRLYYMNRTAGSIIIVLVVVALISEFFTSVVG